MLGGDPAATDGLRYGVELSGASDVRPPVVVWSCTRRCNLHCAHCYADSHDRLYPGELSGDEAREMLEDLAGMGVPALLISGGEPLLRGDVLELARYAVSLGLRVTLSTNGTRISRRVAEEIRAAGVSYVGISLDGIGRTHDRFRGMLGAFEATLRGIRNCRAVGQKVGLRLTLTRHTVRDLDRILELAEREGIERVCLYHLAYAGRGAKISSTDLSPEETRDAVLRVFDRAADLAGRGSPMEILTVDNHADGALLVGYIGQREGEKAGEEALRALRRNGGNRSGVALAHVDNVGEVHPDQFSWGVRLGNVREAPLSELWGRRDGGVLGALAGRRPFLPERCRGCAYLDICNGNLRARALGAGGDLWGMDPSCYLSDEEVAGLVPVGRSG